jgi:dephospho-CoA kinase
MTNYDSRRESQTIAYQQSYGNPMDRLAFIGQMGAGKDTVADIFKDTHKKYSFGMGIRACVKILREKGIVEVMDYLKRIFEYRADYREVYGVFERAQKIPQTKKDREILQYLGTSLRAFYDSVWIDCTFRYIEWVEGLMLPPYRSVIADCRRKPELVALQNKGYLTIFVDAPEEVRYERLKARDGIDRKEFYETSQHVAESEIGSLKRLCDFVVDNSSEYFGHAEYQIKMIRERCAE